MLRITNDRLTLLKLLAVVSMVIDHYNKFSNPDYSQALFAIGRLALPIFIFVLAFNLSRIGPAKMPKIAFRLIIFGLLAIPAYNAMGGAILGGWWPLNILFLLAALVMIVYLLTVPSARSWPRHVCCAAAALLFIIAGALTEFFWAGLGLGLVVWRLFCLLSRPDTKPGRVQLLFLAAPAIAFTALLLLINGNAWALAAVPLILIVLRLPAPSLPRFKWFFYWFYPAHLWALWLIF